MAFATRKSRMAIVKEVSEGTPVAPSSGADFLALQDGFTTDLARNTLDNAELKASIGRSQSLSGLEAPAASLSHYIRHSGTEGVAPQSGYSVVLEAAYGEKTVRSSELVTTGGSTTTVVKVADTSSYRVGDALMVKHASDPWEIAVVKDIPNGTDLTLLFALQVAPASSVSLGKNVTYRAVDDGHPTLSMWDYRGNAGAVASLFGMRVTSFELSATAGDFVGGSFDFEGASSLYDTLYVSSGVNDSLDFDDGGGEENATITGGAYTPADLAEEIRVQMQALTLDTISVSYSNSTGKFTISSTGGTFSLLWNTGTGAGTTIGGLLGFSTAADDTGSTSYVSDSAVDFSSPYTPAFDSPGTPLVAKNNRVMLGSQSDSECFSAQSVTYTLGLPKTDELSLCATSGKSGTVITGREIEVTIVANLPQYKASLFQSFKDNTSVSFQYSFGTKTGSNWNVGESGCVHVKDASVTVHNLGDADGLVTLEITLQGFVDANGTSESSLNLL